MPKEYAMPHDDHAEENILSAMMISDEALYEGLAQLSPEDFFHPRSAMVFSAIAAINETGARPDAVAVARRLKNEGLLEKVGGYAALCTIASNSISLAGWQNSLRIVRGDALSRRVVKAGAAISERGMGGDEEPRELAAEAERILFEALGGTSEKTERSIVDVLGDTLRGFERSTAERSRDVLLGFSSVDSRLMGLRPGQLMVLGARPAVGKSAWALNAAVGAARAGASVLFFSLEMSCRELGERMLSMESGVEYKRLHSGKVRDEDYTRLVPATERLSALDFSIDDCSRATVSDIKAKSRRLLRGKGKSLVVIDYLQLLAPTSRAAKYGNRASEVSEMSRELKILAKELDVPVLALAQLNRGVESRADRRPQLSDLRESGSIEQDADIVCLLDRSMTEEEGGRPGRPPYGETNFIIAKNRSGETGDVPFIFNGSRCTFHELDSLGKRFA